MLVNVQFLRFIAAMLVVVYHATPHVRDAGADPGWFFSFAEATGFAGVDIFFVISGFIMAHTTATSAGPADAWAFLRRRIARIYSGYWPFFLIALAVFWWVYPDHLHEAALARSAVLWPANVLLIAVSWTLVFEMIFYLMFTVLIAARLQRARLCLAALFAGIAAFAAWSHFFRHAYDPGQLETISLAEYYLLSPYLAEFLAGAILANRLLSRPRGPALSLLISGIALYFAGGWINHAIFGGNIEQGYSVFFRVIVFGSAAVLIVAGLVRLDHLGRRAPSWFSLQAGGASYAIYLSHTLLLSVSQHLGLNRWLRSFDATAVQFAFLALSALILLHGIAHYRWVERPLHHRFKNWLRV